MGRKRTRIEIHKPSLDDLCDLVNSTHSLRPNQIGSIEYHSDMTENSIVQIMNQYRGVRQLLCGDEKTLRKYLQNILDGKTILNLNLYKV